jgi:hypothetical protein
MGLFTLSIHPLLFPLCFFAFLRHFLLISNKKNFENEYVLSISGTELTLFKSLEEVISTEKLSEGSTVLRALDKGSAKIGNTF